MEKFYKKVKYGSIASWALVALIVFGLVLTDVSMFLITVIAILLGLFLSFVTTFILIKIENNKVYINKENKKKVLSLTRGVDYNSSFTFINVMDMLCNDAANTKIVKLIVSNYENGKEKSKDTYYINQSDDRMNEMINAICDYKKVKLYSLEEAEVEIMKNNKGKNVIFFNLASLSKLVSESSEYSKYNNCIVVNEVMNSLPKYKQYLNYVEAVYQNNGLVEDKTNVMIDIYLSVLEGKEIVVKDLLGLGVN